MALLSGCHGSSRANTISIEIIPPATGVSVDVGTTTPLNFTAALGDDTSNAGVTWKLSGSTCSGGGCGTLSNPQKLSVSYVPPAAPLPSSAALSVTLTATSVAQKTVTQTATITVEPLPTFTTTSCNPAVPTGVVATCGLAGAFNGQPYSEPIQISGGVQPYTFAITNSNPAALATSVCLNLTVTQTTSTSTAIAGKPCNGTAETVNFTVQATDSGGAAPVTQQYSMNVAAATPLSILTTSLRPASLNAQYSQLVKTSGGVTPLRWSVPPGTLPGGLSLDATKGTITGIPDASDLSSTNCAAPQNQNGNYCFTVTVTDSARIPPSNNPQTASQGYLLTVQAPTTLSISTPAGALAAGTTATGYNATIQATGGVQFTSGSAYEWKVVQGQLPPGLTLAGTSSGNAVISGVPTVAGTYTFTVQVTDAEVAPATQTKTAQYSISITGGQDNNSLLQGSYSFIFHGFDKDGSVAMIGTLTSDGNGNISGAEVVNRGSGVAPIASVSGTYMIDSNTTGTANGASGDGRGVMELTTSVAAQSVTAAYELALQSDGSVQFIQEHAYPSPAPANSDTFATHGAGVMKPVVGGGFGATSFNGNYAFEFTGEDTSKKPDAMAGFVHADGSATVSPGTCDFNDAGTYGSQSISGSFAFSSTIGTAQLTLEVPKSGQQTLQFEFVFVSQSDLYFIETDNNSSAANAPTLYRLSGEMMLQPPDTGFSSSSLSGAAVTTATGVDSSGNAIVSAGLLTSTICDGSTPNTLAGDQNDNGTISTVALSESCTVNPQNGRVAFTWTQPGPFAAAYLIGPGEGFGIGSDATVTTGLIELQTLAPPISNSSVAGAYSLYAPLIAEPGVNNLSGVAVSDGSGDLVGTVDEADASGTSQTLNQGLAAGITSLASNGRGTMTTTAPVPTGFPANWIFYVLSAGQIRAIPADSGTQHPQLIFLGPTMTP